MKPPVKKNKILIIIIGFLVILSLNFFQKEAKGFFYSISSPVQKKLWKAGAGTSNFFGAIFKAKDLKKENENLKLRIQELLSKQNSLEETKKENSALREALDLGIQKEFRLELAEIIGKDINRDTILIDKGFKDGISRGLPVITSQKILIGNIAEVFQNYSKVLLISDKESSFEAQISSSNTSVLVKGLGSSRAFLDFIPKDEEVREGDAIVFRGLLIGLIGKVKKTDVSPFQQAELSLFSGISNLDKIFIIIDF